MHESESDRASEVMQRLRASEELYARAFMSNPVPMSMTDVTTGKFTQINSAFAALVGYHRAEILGRTSEEMGFWPDRSGREDIGRRITRDDSFPLIEATIRVKGGRDLAVLVSFRMLPIASAPAVLSVLVPLPTENAATSDTG